MAAINATAADVTPLYPLDAEVRNRVAAVTINTGQTLYTLPAGTVGLCDASNSSKQQFCGIALNKAYAGDAVAVLQDGEVGGFDVSGLNCGVLVYVNDTAGGVDSAASNTKTVVVGMVEYDASTQANVIRVARKYDAAW